MTVAVQQARRNAQLTAAHDGSADSVRDYLGQISKSDLLTATDEVTLAKRIEAGLAAAERLRVAADNGTELSADERGALARVVTDGQRAKRRFVEANLRLVVSIARRYAGRGLPLLDLIQEGNVGLIRTVEKFDYTLGFKFSTYATWWIKQAITRAMADQSRTIRIPVHMTEVINRLRRVERELSRDLGRDPTEEELSRELEMTPEKIAEVRGYARQPISLDQPVGSEDDAKDTRLGDFIEDPDAGTALDEVTAQLMSAQLTTVLATLTEREAEVVRLRFGLHGGEPHTLDEIGRVIGVTRERIRQIEAKALGKLRHPSRSQALRDYLEA